MILYKEKRLRWYTSRHLESLMLAKYNLVNRWRLLEYWYRYPKTSIFKQADIMAGTKRLPKKKKHNKWKTWCSNILLRRIRTSCSTSGTMRSNCELRVEVGCSSSSKSLKDLSMGSFLWMSSGRGLKDNLLISTHLFIPLKFHGCHFLMPAISSTAFVKDGLNDWEKYYRRGLWKKIQELWKF